MRRFALLCVFLGACSWSSFDDLGTEMWVDSVGGAEGVDPNDFTGVAAPGQTTATSVFVALGRSTDSVGEYDYDDSGVRDDEGFEIRAGSVQFFNLTPNEPIAGDPYSNNVGVAAVTGDGATGDTKVASFPADDIKQGTISNDFNGAGLLDGPIEPTGLVYARTDDAAHPEATDLAIARGPQIALVADYESSTDQKLYGCYGATANDLVLSVGRGQFEADADDELIAVVNDISGTLPQLVIFNGRAVSTTWGNDDTVLQGCFLDNDVDRGPIARINGPAGDADWGRRIVTGDFDGDGDTDIVVGSPATATVTAYMNDGTSTAFTEVNVAPPGPAGQFGAALAAGDLDGDGNDDLVVGAPQANSGDADHAGMAFVYTSDGTNFTKVLDLSDIQPETEQRFGLSAAVVPWHTGDRNMLVIGGDHELYVYFRTTIYDDVRQ